jgi:hypothetical protein
MFWTGLIFNIVGIFFAIHGIVSSKRIEKKILNEKIMIRNEILRIARTHQADVDKILNDRKTFNDPKLNEARIRIEDLKADVDNLNKFAEELQSIN